MKKILVIEDEELLRANTVQMLEFEDFYTRPRNTLDEYLELHTLVESVQTVDTLPYFIYRLIRGAYIFENLAYLELRYTP